MPIYRGLEKMTGDIHLTRQQKMAQVAYGCVSSRGEKDEDYSQLAKNSLRLFTIVAWRRPSLLYGQRKGQQVTPIYLI